MHPYAYLSGYLSPTTPSGWGGGFPKDLVWIKPWKGNNNSKASRLVIIPPVLTNRPAAWCTIKPFCPCCKLYPLAEFQWKSASPVRVDVLWRHTWCGHQAHIPISQIYGHLCLFRSIFIFWCCAVEAIMRIFLFRNNEKHKIWSCLYFMFKPFLVEVILLRNIHMSHESCLSWTKYYFFVIIIFNCGPTFFLDELSRDLTLAVTIMH